MAYKREIKLSDYTPHRDAFLLERCKGKKVLHIGACDWPYTSEKLKAGNLLFAKIDGVAKEQIGIDLDKDSADFINTKKWKASKIIVADMNNLQDIDFQPDVIIFGETLEHLMNLETALSNLKKVMSDETDLIISVPNAVHFLSFIYGILGYEHQHPDHKVAFTYKTLKQLLEFNNFKIDTLKFTWLTGSIKTLNWKGKFTFYLSRPFSRLFPMFSGNILVVCNLK